ncbi:hypothetical protein ACFTSF_16825 [Kribbella sp. NPDC056951]|uniref:hypothetical protein n=1 Tax=Kribbella sp. NPDC056951 TaxID=3345978 RepID=UPI00363C1408
MSQTTPEGGRLSRADRKAARRGTKAVKAAATLKNRDIKQFDRGLVEDIGRSNLTAADLSAMMQRGITGTQNEQARAELSALGQAAQGRMTAARTENPTLGGMLSNAYSRWKDVRRGTKLLKAAGALTAKDAKTINPAIRAQLGHSTMTRSDLAHLAQRNLIQAFRSPGDFEVRPGVQAPESVEQAPMQNGMIQSREAAARGPVQQSDSRLEALLAEMQQLNERLAVLEQQVAEIRAAQQPEAESATAQSAEAQTAEAQSTEAQTPEAQTAQPQTAEGQTAQTQSTEGQTAEAQTAQPQTTEAQSAEAQRVATEEHVGQHEAVPTDRSEAQRWVGAAAGERQPEAAAQQPAAQQPTTEAAAQEPENQQPGEPAPQQPAAESQQAGQASEAPAAGTQQERITALIEQAYASSNEQAGQQPGETGTPTQSAGQQGGEQQPAVREPAAQASPRGTARPVFQEAGGQATTQPGQRPPVQAPTFQAAGQQPNEAARKAEATRAAAAAFDGTTGAGASTAEQAARTAQSDPNKATRGTGQSAAQKNDPNGRGTR